MALTPTPVFPQTPKNTKIQILNATGALTLVTAYTGGANGSKITGLLATSSDTAANTLTWGITASGTFYPLAALTLAITAGQVAGTPALNMFGIAGLPVDNDGQTYIYLNSGDTLQAEVTTVVTSGKAVSITAIGADF